MLHTKNVNITAAATPTNVVDALPTGFVAFINYVFLHNKGSSTNSCTLYLNNSSDNTKIYLLNNKDVDAGEVVEFHDGRFVMYQGDSVVASTGSADDVDVACTFDIVEASTVLSNFNRV
jgi:hypothetical protein